MYVRRTMHRQNVATELKRNDSEISTDAAAEEPKKPL